MSKKFILMALVLFVSTLALSACFPKKSVQQEAVDSMVAQSEDGIFSGSLKQLMGMGKAQKCTWKGEQGEEGVVYTDGTRSRFEASGYSMMGDDQEENSELVTMFGINDDEYVYTWSSQSKEGMKMSNETEEEQQEMEEYDSEKYDSSMDYRSMSEYDFEYKCEGWSVDENMFVPPSDIEFKDLTKMMENMQESLKGMEGVCDMLEGEDKEECLEGFNQL